MNEMKEITGQKKIVLDLIRNLCPVRTEILKIEAMKRGVSCPDRYARWLAEDGLVCSYKDKGDRTKTWTIVAKLPVYNEPIYQVDEKGQLAMGI